MATIELIESTQGFTSVWWMSRLTPDYGQAVGFMSIPVFGRRYDIANRRVSQIASEVFDLFSTVSGGQAPVVGVILKLAHVQLHLEELVKRVDSQDVVKQASILYEFLLTCRVSNAIQMLSEELDVPMKTMKDRVDRARDRGLLERPGRGKRFS